MKHLGWICLGVFALAGVGSWTGCGANANRHSRFDEDEESTDTNGAGAGSATDGKGGGDFVIPFGSGTGVGGGCATSSSQAEKVPLDMYIMLDKSGSMNNAGGTTTKWEATTSALKAFVNAPEAAGMGVGIDFFPDDFASCSAAAYESPTQEIVELPGGASLIIDAINSTFPSGGTPTLPSLQGAIDHAKNWMSTHPGRIAIVTYATDGNPSDCGDLNAVYAAAAAGFNGTPSVRTYVIGVGLSTNTLNEIALNGGTNQAYLVDSDAMATQKLVEALKDIQGTALGCAYTIPTPKEGEKPDYGSVNVQYTPGAGMPVIIPKSKGIASCTAEGGWYYDNDAAPTQIVLCDSTCSAISADTKGKVDIVLGCVTIAG